MNFRALWPCYEVCNHTPIDEVEWLSNVRPGMVPYGLLVRVWPADGPEPAKLHSPVDPKPAPRRSLVAPGPKCLAVPPSLVDGQL
jgi:hypothetical protein